MSSRKEASPISEVTNAGVATLEPPPFDRSSGIGGSDIAAILGVSPFRSEWDVWLEKVHDPSWSPQTETPAMRFGRMLEPIIAQLYEETKSLGVDLHPDDDAPMWHPNGIMYAHLDGFVYESEYLDKNLPADPDRSIGVFEAKAPRFKRDWENGVPMYYESQARAYRLITGKPWVDVAALYRDTAELEVFRIEPAPLDDAIVKRCEEWWDLRVVRGVAPPIDASAAAARYIGTKHYEPTSDEVLIADSTINEAVSALINLRHLIADREKSEEILKRTIQTMVGEYSRVEGAGWHIIYKRTKPATTVAWKEVASAYRKIIEERLDDEDLSFIENLYTTVGSGSRPFIVKEDKE